MIATFVYVYNSCDQAAYLAAVATEKTNRHKCFSAKIEAGEPALLLCAFQYCLLPLCVLHCVFKLNNVDNPPPALHRCCWLECTGSLNSHAELRLGDFMKVKERQGRSTCEGS